MTRHCRHLGYGKYNCAPTCEHGKVCCVKESFIHSVLKTKVPGVVLNCQCQSHVKLKMLKSLL